MVSCDDLRVQEILDETQLVEVCFKILTFSQNSDIEFYCIKLEVYWILINLLTTNDTASIFTILGVSNNQLSSELLNFINEEFVRIIQENTCDVKMMH